MKFNYSNYPNLGTFFLRNVACSVLSVAKTLLYTNYDIWDTHANEKRFDDTMKLMKLLHRGVDCGMMHVYCK